MRVFFRFFLMSIQDSLAYRWNIIFAVMSYSLNALVGLHIVKTVYAAGHSFGSYTEESLLLYYLIILSMDACLFFADAWNIVDEIHSGKIVNFLVKPVSFMKAHAATYLGKVVIRALTVIPAVILAFYYLNIDFSRIQALHIWAFLPLFILGIFLQISTVVTLGILSFPLQRSSGAIFSFQTIILLTGGKMLPLALFPDWMESFFKLLPFHFLNFTPISTLLGEATYFSYSINLLMVTGWLGLAAALLWLLWRRGMKTYEGFGQ